MSKSLFKLVLASVIMLKTFSLIAQDDKPVHIEAWVTNPDRSALFAKQPDNISFTDMNNNRGGSVIVIDDLQLMQTIDGFGFALTGGSAGHLIKMDADKRAGILKELFAFDDNNIGVSYLRLSIGASDLNSFVFSYNDLPEGETDYELIKFSLAQDLKDIIPVLKEILAINPAIKILGSPWSAPAWMKTNNNIRGGQLKKECYGVYALYFVKYIQSMKIHGIAIDAITIQNEPLNSRNTPSMFWFENEQADFIKNYLGPAFKKAGIKTKIILFDHNLDRPDYPLVLLSDPDASKFVRPGSTRIMSTNKGEKSVALYEDEQRPGVFRAVPTENTDVLPNVAFKTPEGKIVLIVVNDTWATNSFRIQYRGKYASLRLNPGAAGTFVW